MIAENHKHWWSNDPTFDITSCLRCGEIKPQKNICGHRNTTMVQDRLKDKIYCFDCKQVLKVEQ